MTNYPEHSENTSLEANESYEEFVRLFARHEPQLRAFVRSLVVTLDATDEVIQETSLVLWRKFGSYESGSNFLNWSCTIARFEVLKFRRKMARDRLVFSEELISLLAEESITKMERLAMERRILNQCIEKLTPRQQELIRFVYVQGTTVKDVAIQLGQSAKSLYKVMNRIRSTLLRCVETTLSREGLL